MTHRDLNDAHRAGAKTDLRGGKLVDLVEANGGGRGGSRTRTSSRSDEQPVLVALDSVQPEPVRWLWGGRIPLGKLTVIDGDPGLGKSMITLDLAARLSSGAKMPDGTSSDCDGPAGIVLLSAEDDLADTIRPRLDAAGADVTRIIALTALRSGVRERMPSLDALHAIADAIKRIDARLVVVDPLMAYLPSRTDSHRDQDIRALLAPLGQLAAQHRVALVIVRHLNKHSGGNPLYRGGGSIGIVGAARSGLLVARDPDDAEGQRRILAVTKSNSAGEAPALAYRIDGTGTAPLLVWEGTTKHTAAELVAERADDRGERGALFEARAWLAEVLTAGPKAAKDVQRAARSVGISEATLRRARESLVHVERIGGGIGQRWIWVLKPDPTEMFNQPGTQNAHLALSISEPRERMSGNERSQSEAVDAERVEHLSSSTAEVLI